MPKAKFSRGRKTKVSSGSAPFKRKPKHYDKSNSDSRSSVCVSSTALSASAAADEKERIPSPVVSSQYDHAEPQQTAVQQLLKLVGAGRTQSLHVESDSDDDYTGRDQENFGSSALVLDDKVLGAFTFREDVQTDDGKAECGDGRQEDSKEQDDDDDDDNAGLLLGTVGVKQLEADAADSCGSAFSRHYQTVLPAAVGDQLSEHIRWNSERHQWPALGHINFQTPDITAAPAVTPGPLDEESPFVPSTALTCGTSSRLVDYGILPRIVDNMAALNRRLFSAGVTQLQREVLSIVGDYRDLYLPHQTTANADQLRVTYLAHILCHLLRTRTRILHNNAKMAASGGGRGGGGGGDQWRDQGLTRPRVLLLLPFRHSVLCAVNTLIWLLQPEARANVYNYRRFVDEFGDGDESGGGGAQQARSASCKPADFCATFAGNTDDAFRLGVQLTKNSVRLYSDFYQSDLIVASPLGLRPLISSDAGGPAKRDFDYLNSIELLVVDQCDVYLMQNWEHLVCVLQHLHKQPQSGRGVDFSRVRQWCLHGWQSLYRQTVVLAALPSAEINALASTHCHNYQGRAIVYNPPPLGAIQRVLVPAMAQRFYRFAADSPQHEPQLRFDFFVQTILAHYRNTSADHVMVYVPSYFDYVRLRNYFIDNTVNFTQICEYTSDARVRRARDMFFHGKRTFLLYTERFHFYHRYRIKGVRHVIFYALPTYGHFYAELCNLMQECYQNPRQERPCGDSSCCVLYSQLDQLRLARVLGASRAASMVRAAKDMHMFVTSDL